VYRFRFIVQTPDGSPRARLARSSTRDLTKAAVFCRLVIGHLCMRQNARVNPPRRSTRCRNSRCTHPQG